MAKSAWETVSQDTIKHCWDHTQIQPDSPNAPASPSRPRPPHADPVGWKIVREFATTEMNLPEVEAPLAAVMDAEGDVATAMKAIEPLYDAADRRTGIKIRIPAAQPPPQLSDAETTLMTSITALQQRNRIFGEPLSLEEILDPAEEREIGSSGSGAGVATDKAIAALVRWEMAAAHGDVIEVDSDSDDDEDSGPAITREKVLELCYRENSGYFELTYDGKHYLMLRKHLSTHTLLVNYMVCTL
ncbi:hypothetical protein BU15DRAFT_70035 [Melanogaster broomeanus]|nr:hypothetical protein BU15DRAFT_70035 [Melanogaster broomeanus]